MKQFAIKHKPLLGDLERLLGLLRAEHKLALLAIKGKVDQALSESLLQFYHDFASVYRIQKLLNGLVFDEINVILMLQNATNGILYEVICDVICVEQ